MTAMPIAGAPVSLTVIGRCAVAGPAGERVIAGRRARPAFVALVFADGAAVSRDELAFALWGDQLLASWAPSLLPLIIREQPLP